MKIELTNEQVVELIESLDHEENFHLMEVILNQVLGSDADEYDADEQCPICARIYAIVDALDDLEEAYERVSISTGLV